MHESTPIRVLHVDDDDGFRRSVARSLSRYGSFELRETASNDEAFAVLADWRPDLIFTDLNRPDADGLEFIERLRSDEATRDIPIVVLSGYVSFDQSALRGLRVEAVLVKPCPADEIIEAVKSAVRPR